MFRMRNPGHSVSRIMPGVGAMPPTTEPGSARVLERGGTPACPEEYVVWARGVDGDCKVAKRFMP